jgi:hypothetical protein
MGMIPNQWMYCTLDGWRTISRWEQEMAAYPVCEFDPVHYYGVVGPDVQRFDRRRCGEFELTGTAVATLPNEIGRAGFDLVPRSP